MADKLLTKLLKATKGLLFPSEYDAPLEPFVWERAENTLSEIRRLCQRPKEPCKVVSLDEFFEGLEEEEGFAALAEILRSALNDVKVYRFGTANLTIYVVGKDAQGRLVGFKTAAVET